MEPLPITECDRPRRDQDTERRDHIQAHGTAADGRLFQTYRGGIYLPSTLWRVLQEARLRTFTQAQLASPLARRPYDFRHAGVSWRLNAGTPAPLSQNGQGTP
jgi:integrase